MLMHVDKKLREQRVTHFLERGKHEVIQITNIIVVCPKNIMR